MSTVRVAVTGAAGQISYALLPLLVSGRVFGPKTKVVLQLLEIEKAQGALKGVAMELQDCAFPLLAGCICTADPEVAFADADVAIFVGGMPRGPGMLRADLLVKNAPIFVSQGKALNKVAKKTCKSVVVANPCNSNCYVLRQNAPDLPDENFSALTRLDHNRATGQVAELAGVSASDIRGLAIWGNHSKTMVPDISRCEVNLDGEWTSLSKVIKEKKEGKQFSETFVSTIQGRGAAIIKQRGKSSAMSAAHAVAEHVRDWVGGSGHTSMAVVSNGSYGIQKGLIFSFPVELSNGSYKIVKDLDVSGLKKGLEATENELKSEAAALTKAL